MSCPAAARLQHSPPAFVPIWCCGCYYPCLHKGCSRSTRAKSDPKQRLVVVEYEMPLERRCRAPTAARLHHGPPGFLPILVLRLIFSAQGCSQSTRVQRGPKCPSSDRVGNAPSTQALRHVLRAERCLCSAPHSGPPAFLPILPAQLKFSAYTRMP